MPATSNNAAMASITSPNTINCSTQRRTAKMPANPPSPSPTTPAPSREPEKACGLRHMRQRPPRRAQSRPQRRPGQPSAVIAFRLSPAAAHDAAHQAREAGISRLRNNRPAAASPNRIAPDPHVLAASSLSNHAQQQQQPRIDQQKRNPFILCEHRHRSGNRPQHQAPPINLPLKDERKAANPTNAANSRRENRRPGASARAERNP